MLVLTRKSQEQIRVGGEITITVLRVKGNSVRIGIEAPRDVRVVRGELPPKELVFDIVEEPAIEGESAESDEMETSPKKRTLKDFVAAAAHAL